MNKLLGLLLFLAVPAFARPLPDDATIVQLFEWRWDAISAECPRLAAYGIHYVHVSPPNEHRPLPGSPWYDRYQPVSYRLGNRGGDEAAFRSMIHACRREGVHVLVDAVINHMAIIPPEGVQRFGNLGTPYWRYSFPGLYSFWDFHRCDRNPPDSFIYNYNDRYEVQSCNLAGLADLATSTDYVRDTLAAYLRGLVDMGVSGFRIDAAKHMPSVDIGAVLARMERPQAIVFQEVIGSPSEPIKAREYLPNGSVSEFGFAARVGWRFRDGKLAGLVEELQLLDLASSDAVVFIDNHDTQRGHGAGQAALTYKQGTRYALANAFMLAWPYGHPILMSSFRFQSDQDGPPRGADGLVTPIGASCGRDDAHPWVCEHRWPIIATMAHWRQLVMHEPVREVQTRGDLELAFSRGEQGFVAFNLGASTVDRTFRTTLRPGLYANMLAPSESVRVTDDGLAHVRLHANAVVAIHASRRRD